MEDQNKKAQRLLRHLRSMIDKYESFLGYLLSEVQKGGLTLEEIGTSEEELEKLRVKSYKVLAQMFLKYIRSGIVQYESYLRYMLSEVQKGGLTLEDIGTSEEELEKLRVKTIAQMFLKYLRSGTDQYESYLGYLRSEVQKGGLTLEYIGTSEEELEKLRPATVKR